MLDANTANESELAGTMNLSHSLLRSRTIWLTTAFVQSDVTESMDISQRRDLGTAEIQLGPHIFVRTHFYSIASPVKADDGKAKPSGNTQQAPKQNDSLVFEFAENKGVYFCIPLDFDIVDVDSIKTSIQACFYANPPPPQDSKDGEGLSISKSDRYSDYPKTEQIFTRVNVSLNEISNPVIVDKLLRHYNDPLNTVWRDYRRALCKDRPVVKYAQSFFPPKHRELVQTAAPCRRKEPPVSGTAQSSKAMPTKAEPRQQPPQHGGKIGYTASVAAARLEYFTYSKESSDESSADEQENSGSIILKLGSSASRGSSSTPASPNSTKPKTRSAVGKRAKKAKKSRLANSPNSCGRVCTYCKCDETPIWRRGPSGAGTLCNACGVKWKLGKILQ